MNYYKIFAGISLIINLLLTIYAIREALIVKSLQDTAIEFQELGKKYHDELIKVYKRLEKANKKLKASNDNLNRLKELMRTINK